MIICTIGIIFSQRMKILINQVSSKRSSGCNVLQPYLPELVQDDQE
jgi:hypothetical protein